MSDVDEAPEERQEGLRADFAAAAVIVVGCVGAVLWSGVGGWLTARPTQGQCEALLELWIDHTQKSRSTEPVAEGWAGPLPGATAHAARHQRSVASCEHQLTADQVECALASPNVDELERCLQ